MNWSPFANHLWQSSLFAGMIALLALTLKQNRAELRHRLWLAASIKFLVPFSLLLTIGGQLDWRAGPAIASPEQSAFTSAISQISQPFASPIPTAAAVAAPSVPASLPSAVLFAWLAGCAFVLARWWVRWRRVRTALRSASRLPIQAPVEVRSSRTRLEPGIFGIFRPVLLLPEGIADRLTPAQFRAILAHEFCHVRRRDNLAAAVHMLVEGLFWFHPLVWWIGARMIDERERACDEEVLRQGSEPEVYVAGILSVCKFYLESPLACASGVTGADLKTRIEAIMTARILHNLTLTRKLLLASAGVAAIAGPIVIGMVDPPQARAQAAPIRFEVATIKPITTAGGMRGGMQTLPGGGLRMSGVTLKGLISLAYDVRESQISGGPAWIASETYDVNAKPEPPDAASGPHPAPGSPAWIRLRQRIQSLLTERFQLVVHKDAKPGQIYALVLAKGGFKLKPSESGADIPPGTMRNRSQINGRNAPITMLANVLSNWLGRPVEDRTGITGRYDYKLEYAPEPVAGDTPDPNSSGASIFTALQEQLGLKLEPARGSIVTLVIDRAEKPSAN